MQLAKSKDVFKDNTNWVKSEGDDPESKPGLVWFHPHPLTTTLYEDIKGARSTRKGDKARQGDVARVSWPWLILAVEIKRTDSEAGFHFATEGFRHESDIGLEARVQHLHYAEEIMDRQFRTHAFTIYVCGKFARLFRWDRTGAIVSTAINLTKDRRHLLDLVFGLASLGREHQGYDSSAQLATEAEIAHLEEYSPENKYLQNCRRYILVKRHQRLYPIYKVCPSSSHDCVLCRLTHVVGAVRVAELYWPGEATVDSHFRRGV